MGEAISLSDELDEKLTFKAAEGGAALPAFFLGEALLTNSSLECFTKASGSFCSGSGELETTLIGLGDLATVEGC